jgi:hypothetical protein
MSEQDKPKLPVDNDPPMQGEGNYTAARRYDKAQREFVESGQVPEAARDAAPDSAAEAEELQRAEREGRAHSKGEDRARPTPPEQPQR